MQQECNGRDANRRPMVQNTTGGGVLNPSATITQGLRSQSPPEKVGVIQQVEDDMAEDKVPPSATSRGERDVELVQPTRLDVPRMATRARWLAEHMILGCVVSAFVMHNNHLDKQHATTSLKERAPPGVKEKDMVGPSPKQMRLDFETKPTSGAELNRLVGRYVVEEMLPVNTVDSPSFRAIAVQTRFANLLDDRGALLAAAKDHLTEKERKEVAHAMCHDPSTAALPDKKMANQMRKLRMKALKEAFMKSSQDSNEKSEATLDTSLDDGEGIYDDAPESSSSLSSGEKSTLKRRNERLHGFSEPNYESSEDEPPSSPDTITISLLIVHVYCK
ncbi:hypothetical protein D9C73_000910 [Collichthys lucidus]|uniref:Uncharacterized protein n=1 Tax=Collichthys lucidus TaxID=240159 RepID=A0A4U5U148_COLLU|nr:hypothetical protein D9C73_000910 [Collichthys lucidus]